MPALVAPYRAQILVEQGNLRRQVDGLIQLRGRFVVPTLFRQCPAEHREMLDASGIGTEMVAADFLREQRTVRLHGGNGLPDARFGLGHQRTASDLANAGPANRSGGR